jgi:hypothetical protein
MPTGTVKFSTKTRATASLRRRAGVRRLRPHYRRGARRNAHAPPGSADSYELQQERGKASAVNLKTVEETADPANDDRRSLSHRSSAARTCGEWYELAFFNGQKSGQSLSMPAIWLPAR